MWKSPGPDFHRYLTTASRCLAQAQRSENPAVPPIVAEYNTSNVQAFGHKNALERTETGKFYRDSMGRTRVEQRNVIMISDPVARLSFLLDPNTKLARRGKTVHRYRNIQNAEPDPVLFRVPERYRIVDANPMPR